ncbi:Mitochondria fission 1 protein [Cryoendolithus antarcticus]|uniref:Mitochondrial fission 1 protein n=1 Tax=Cryoendolithus antarcticus TaxID=1507870 RepID=A0A1V8S8R7_9PEZI|nr:Mitochondria fission 1 protein [Cryoendolithus antarcticus]
MTSDKLPYAADAEREYEKEDPYPSLQTKFNYAWGLIKSSTRQDQQDGVRLLSEIFRASPDRRRECLYYLGLGNYKLGNYAEARRYNDSLLEIESGNMQAQSLRDLIEDKVAKEGLYGVAIVGGLAVAAGVVGGLIMRSAQRKR